MGWVKSSISINNFVLSEFLLDISNSKFINLHVEVFEGTFLSISFFF